MSATFYSELKQLNLDLLSYIKEVLDKSPYFDLTPTLQDYIQQFEEIDKKFKPNNVNSTEKPPLFSLTSNATSLSKSNATATTTFKPTTTTTAPAPAPAPQFSLFSNIVSAPTTLTVPTSSSLSTASNPSTAPSTTTSGPSKPLFSFSSQPTSLFSSPLSFNAPAKIASTTTASTTSSTLTTPTFSFGSTALNTSTTLGSASFGTSFGAAPSFGATIDSAAGSKIPTANFFAKPKESEEEQPGAEDEEHEEPPVVEPDSTYDEPDTKMSFKCKLYSRSIINGQTEISLVGSGRIFIKETETKDKHHIIVRQSPDFRKVIFNHVITAKGTPIREIPKTGVSVMVPVDGENKLFIIKLKETEAKDVFNALTGKSEPTTN